MTRVGITLAQPLPLGVIGVIVTPFLAVANSDPAALSSDGPRTHAPRLPSLHPPVLCGDMLSSPSSLSSEQ
jgi:hypothetical protein